jgi:hypothetical protein
MSITPSPSVEIEIEDPLLLDAELKRLNLEYRAHGKHYQPNPIFSEEENSKAAKLHQDKLAELIRLQLGIIMKLRKTQTGPAKSGATTRRGKRAPLDMKAMADAIFTEVAMEQKS